MKKKIFIAVILVLTLMLSLVACKPKGQKEVQSLKVLEGIKAEYQLNETPDFSGLKVLVTYNDQTTKEVGYSDVTISTLDTSVTGEAKITITYENKSIDVNVTVKANQATEAILTGIEYQSGLPDEIFETEDKYDTISLKVIANYSDGTSGYVNAEALTTNLGDLDFTTAGTKTVVITYQGKTCEHTITVKKVEIIGIAVKAGTVDTVVEAGGELDLSTIEVYAIYNDDPSNHRVLISNNDPDLDLTKIPDLSTEGDKEYKITYKTFSTTLIISTTPAVLESIQLHTDKATKKILLGDKLSTGNVTATAILSNNTTDDVSNSELTFSYDITKAGTSTVTVSYTLNGVTKSATYDVTVLGIKSVVIDTNSIDITLNLNGSLNTNELNLIVEDEEGSKHNKSMSSGEITVDTSNLNLSVVGKNSYITATYRGVTSDKVYITVTDGDYYITGVSLPKSLANWLATSSEDPDAKLMKDHFKLTDHPYVVGDDNPFYFTLVISAYDENAQKVDVPAYTSVSSVYLGDSTTPLSGAELAKYVSIDELNHGFQFTSEAVGETFKLETRPAKGVAGYESDFTKSITVTVVDGWNIYKAWELNYITNWADFDFTDVDTSETRNQVQIVQDYLKTERLVANIPSALNGIVLHNNIYITPDDLPAEYFLDKDRTKELYDRINVFSHINTDKNPDFTVYGNYFTINSNALPPVVANGTGNQTDLVSNAQLFGFSVDSSLIKSGHSISADSTTVTIPNYDHTQYSTTIKDLFLRDDNPTSNTPADSPRRMRGLIGIKSWAQKMNIENSRFEAFYISYLADSDFQTLNINDSIFYNSWQNHLFIWSDNPYVNDDYKDYTIQWPTLENDAWTYPVLTVNTKNSTFTKSGGPTIISNTNDPELVGSEYSGPVINLDATADDLWTYVTGTEAWFQSMGTIEIAGQQVGILQNVALTIKALNAPLQSACGGSFVTTSPKHEGITGGEFMNIIYANLAAGMDLQQTLNGTQDLDGVLSIGGNNVVDMTDTNGLGYANTVVGMVKNHETFGKAPIFVSSEGGIGIVNQLEDETYVVISNIYTTFIGAGVVTVDQVIGMAGDQILLMNNYSAEAISKMTEETKAATIASIVGSTDNQKMATIALLDEANTKLLGQGDYLTLYYNNMGILLQYNLDKVEE